jgi:hypothetical protein
LAVEVRVKNQKILILIGKSIQTKVVLIKRKVLFLKVLGEEEGLVMVIQSMIAGEEIIIKIKNLTVGEEVITMERKNQIQR